MFVRSKSWRSSPRKRALALDAVHMIASLVLLDRHEAFRAAFRPDLLGPITEQNVISDGLASFALALE
jgi:hypothetical protein